MSSLPPDVPGAPRDEPPAPGESDTPANGVAANGVAANDSASDPEPPVALPGWEQWEASLERIGGATGTPSAEASADETPAPQRPPFPTDEFGFLDLPHDFTIAAAKGVADPAAWPTDEEWRRAADPTPSQGVAAVGDPAPGSGVIERSQAGAQAWGRAAGAALPREPDEPASGEAAAAASGTESGEPTERERAAALLAALADRVRSGALPVPPLPAGAKDAAVLAAVLAALLSDEAAADERRRADA